MPTAREIAILLVQRLQAALPDFDATDIFDAFWLAARRQPTGEALPRLEPPVEPGQTAENRPKSRLPAREKEAPRGDRAGDEPPRAEETDDKQRTEDEPREAELSVPDQDARPSLLTAERSLPVGVPGARALPNALALARALRPLRRRVDSRTRFVLDEETTVHESAERRRLTPMVRPQRERWLDLALLVDSNPSMLTWQPTVRAFRLLCESLGPFRDVRTWQFDTSGQEATLRTTQGDSKRDARELLGSGGRRVVLVVSDCLGPAWTSGAAARTLQRWQHDPPTAILHLLPPSLWRQSALGDTPMVRVRSRAAAVSNRLLSREQWRRWDRDPGDGVLLPLLTLEPEFLSAWAGLIAGRPGAVLPAVLLPPDPPRRVPVGAPVPPPSPATLVERFRRRASVLADQLASLFASVTPLRLPLLRLVQEAMLPASRQIHLAEVLHSGLLRRKTLAGGQSPTEQTAEFEWLPGVVDYLLDQNPINQSIEVYRRVSQFVGSRFGLDVQFEALLRDPGAEIGPSATSAQPFATIPAGLLRRLGGKYRAAADRLEGRRTSPDPFLSVPRLREIVANTNYLRRDESIIGELLIFKTAEQRTWLLASPREVFILLDDAQTRKDGNVLQDHFFRERALNLRFGIDGNTGWVRFVSRRVTWYYSRSLFAEPEQLEEAIHALAGAPDTVDKFDWSGRSILWVDRDHGKESKLQIKLANTGAEITPLAEDYEALVYRLSAMDTHDAVLCTGMNSGAVRLLRALRELGNRIAFVILGESDTPEARQEADRLRVLACTPKPDVALRALNDHFRRPPGPHVGRRVLLIDIAKGSDMRFRYDLEAKGVRFFAGPASREEASFDAVVFMLSTAGFRTAVTDSDLDRVRSFASSYRGAQLIYGRHKREDRELLLGQGAWVVTNSSNKLHSILDYSVFSDHQKYLDPIQECCFVAWATPACSPSVIRALLHKADPGRFEPLWAKRPTGRLIADAAVAMLAEVFGSRQVEIYQNDSDGGSETLFADNPLWEWREIMLRSHREPGFQRPSSPFFGGPGRSRIPLGLNADGKSSWGVLYVGSGRRSLLTARAEEWLFALTASLGQAIVAAEGKEQIRDGIPISAFERGVTFLRENLHFPDQAEQLISAPDSRAWTALRASLPTETMLVTRLMELLAAMWRPARWEVWVLIDDDFRLVAASLKTRTPSLPVLVANESGLLVDEPDCPDDSRAERCRLAVPIRGPSDSSHWGILAMAHLTTHRFQGAAAWIQKLLPLLVDTLIQMERLGGIAAELRLHDFLTLHLRSIQSASDTGQEAVISRAAARALPFLLLATPPETAAYTLAAVQVRRTSPTTGSADADEGRPAASRPPLPISNEANLLVREQSQERELAVSVRVLARALAAQSEQCKVSDDPWRYRDFLFLCHSLAEHAEEASSPHWRDAFLHMLEADLDRTASGENFAVPGALGPLWQDEDSSTPWALPSPVLLPARPVKRVHVVGASIPTLAGPLSSTCRHLGQELARLGYGLVIGNHPGVDLAVTQAFADAIPPKLRTNYLTQVRELGQRPTNIKGSILLASGGSYPFEALLTNVDGVILLGGAQGTWQVASDADRRGIPVFPIAQTGGSAERYYRERTSQGLPQVFEPVAGRHEVLNQEIPVSIDLLFHLLEKLPVPEVAGKSRGKPRL